MNINNLNDLPEWEDNKFNNGDNDGEGWKPNPTSAACKAMYLQWNTVMMVLKAAFESLKEPGVENAVLEKEYLDDHVRTILSDAYQVAVKIKSSEAGLYAIRMENAAIIRKNAQFIKISTNDFMLDGLMDPQHRHIIRDEIDRFRELFKKWVASFEKDEFEDEWGLFI